MAMMLKEVIADLQRQLDEYGAGPVFMCVPLGDTEKFIELVRKLPEWAREKVNANTRVCRGTLILREEDGQDRGPFAPIDGHMSELEWPGD